MKTYILILLSVISISSFAQTDKEIIGQWKFEKITNENDSLIETLKANITLSLNSDKSFSLVIEGEKHIVKGTWEIVDKKLVLKNSATDPFEQETEEFPIYSYTNSTLVIVQHKIFNDTHNHNHDEKTNTELTHLIKI